MIANRHKTYSSHMNLSIPILQQQKIHFYFPIKIKKKLSKKTLKWKICIFFLFMKFFSILHIMQTNFLIWPDIILCQTKEFLRAIATLYEIQSKKCFSFDLMKFCYVMCSSLILHQVLLLNLFILILWIRIVNSNWNLIWKLHSRQIHLFKREVRA